MNALINKYIRNQKLIPVIEQLINRNYAEMRRWQLEKEILGCQTMGICSDQLLESGQLIVSLTSYGRRLYDAAYAVESIMQQTIKPNKIILWIDDRDKCNIPQALKQQQVRGLEIKPTAPDYRSYKKLIHTLESYPDDTIITIDDDVMYEFDLIERLLTAHKSYPKDICAARVHRIKRDAANVPIPYNKWDWTITELSAHPDNFLTGVGGVLYPPHSLADETTNGNLFTKLAPTADDVWFFFMARLKGTLVRKIATRNRYGHDYLENIAYNGEGLMQVNTRGECLNDRQIAAVMNHFNI